MLSIASPDHNRVNVVVCVQVLLQNYGALKTVFKYFSATGIESGDVFNMGMLSFTELCQVCNHLQQFLGLWLDMILRTSWTSADSIPWW